MISLKVYGSDSSSSSSSEDESEDACRNDRGLKTAHLRPIFAPKTLQTVEAAPTVLPKDEVGHGHHALIDPSVKELNYNARYEDLYAPMIGPENPFKTQQEAATKNMLSGYVEPAHVNEFQFEKERRTFHSFGYAHDPSAGCGTDGVVVGGVAAGTIEEQNDTIDSDFKSIFEADSKERPLDKRKRDKNDDPSDIEGYQGPWAKFENEVRVSRPSEEDTEYLNDYLSKMKKRAKKQVQDKPVEELSTMHIKDAYDYQNRSFLHVPQDVGVNLRQDNVPDKCFIPKRQIHEWKGHNRGVSCMKWFPVSGHLLLSGSMDTKIKIWEVYRNRRCIQTYSGHRMAVRDVDFSNSGEQFLSTSYDRFIKLWNTETGQCVNRFTNGKVGYCVKFNPEDDKQHLFVVGTADKKIVTWDIRSNEIVQEYDRHLGAVNTITFVDENRRFVSTSDDKSLRVWEWDIPVDMKYIADPSMHSMPAVTKSPNGKWLACQSLDNKICIFTCGERFKLNRKKEFKGHMVAGYACTIDFSPDMSYILSGDGDGKCCIWDWKTTRMVAKWKAHHSTCISVLWHPHETSKVATAGWDGLIKFWD